MTYNEWVLTVPEELSGDTLWNFEAYRLAVFLKDLAWSDVTTISQDRRTRGITEQKYRAVGSISAKISEGYSRSTGKQRACFYEYALGSSRESRDWYYQCRHVLGERVTKHRMTLTTQIIKLLLTMIPDQRQTNPKLRQPPKLSRNHVIT